VLPGTMDLNFANNAGGNLLLLNGGTTQTVGALSGANANDYIAGFGSASTHAYTGFYGANVNASNSFATLQVGNTGDSATFAGVIGAGSSGDTSANSAGIKLEKLGAGTQTFTGSNAYAGGTIVTLGTLVSSNANALGSGSITVNGGKLQLATATTAGGNLNIAGGTLDNAGNTLTLGTNAFTMSSGTLLDNLTSPILSGSGTFAITGGFLDLTGASINYTNTYTLFNSLTGTVSGLSFLGVDTNYTPSISTSGVLSFAAVPEPSTWALLGLSGLFLVVAARRRRNA
jgi:fibronectin-binding autotransporter adhesin